MSFTIFESQFGYENSEISFIIRRTMKFYIPKIATYLVAIYNDNKINETDSSNSTRKLV